MIQLKTDSHDNIFLQLDQVWFQKYNAPAFENVNWEIRERETWAITGASGSGKTTLAEALAGRHRLVHGALHYHFIPESNSHWDLKKYVAFISFQPNEKNLNYGNYYYQQRYNSSDADGLTTVKEFLLSTTNVTEEDKIWNNVVQVLRLKNLLDLEVIKLSNGQTRKMLIARALLAEPRLLILDNPFTGLDKQSRYDFNLIIKHLIQEGTEVILVTNQADLPDMVTHVLVLDNFTIKGAFSRQDYLKLNPVTAQLGNSSLPEPVPALFLHSEPTTDFTVAVKFENAIVNYDGNKVLNQINWTVKRGDKWALLGPNGSGKTTLLSLINGDNPQAFSNKITLFDRRKGTGESIWDIKKRIGFISPELHLYFRQNLTAEAVVATGFSDTVFPKKSFIPAEAQALSNLFSYYEMEPLRKKSFLHLSAGEQRLILIIRSLVKNPPLLIWDEPYQGLSEFLIKRTQDLLTAFASPDKTVIFVSHYDQEIPAWLNKRLVLESGQVKEMFE